MVEVGGSNPPGPTKIKNPPLGGFFGFGGLVLVRTARFDKRDQRRIGSPEAALAHPCAARHLDIPPVTREGTRRVKTRKATAFWSIHSRPSGTATQSKPKAQLP